ncbi:hypothetical protein [Sphingomonas sp. MMS24-J13]|uniref:hypothetical protein n=1 Tax=Sphingomonas sp. MMS24-J13 TaxID=3238686 RepID=UPI00384FBB16
MTHVEIVGRSAFLIAACGLVGCHRVAPVAIPQTGEQRITAWYQAWAAQQPRPSREIVDRVERLIAGQPCIGRLGQWSRSYAFHLLPNRTAYTQIIDFHFEEAGTPEVQVGRQVTAPAAWVNLDDRPIRMASGDYDLRDNRIRVEFCGANAGERRKDDINNIRTYFDELELRRSPR